MSHFNDRWYGEIIALLFSLACSVAIVVVLLVYNNKPTPKLPKDITLNAIVSVLATASKAGLLFTTSSCLGQLKWTWFKTSKARSLAHAEIFDGASRGPLGALGLFRSEPRKSVASLVAMLTLLALAYDPFVQQVINISPEVRYSASNSVVTKQATRLAISSLEIRSLQALNAGIYTDRFDRSPACSTGNCTFSRFSSVGWCSTCSQPTDWEFVDGCSLIFNDTDFSVQTGKLAGQLVSVNRTCRLTSGSGHSQDLVFDAGGWVNLNYNYGIEVPSFQITTEFGPESVVQDPRFPWGGRVPMGEWAFAQFKISDWSLAVDSVEVCTLDLCLRDYEVTVDGGTTHATASNPRFGRRYFRSQNFTESTWQEASNGGFNFVIYMCWEPEGAPKNSSWVLEDLPSAPFGDASQFYASPSDFASCIEDEDYWNWYGTIAVPVNGMVSTNIAFGKGSTVENGTVHFNNTDMPFHTFAFTSHNGSATLSDPAYYASNKLGSETQGFATIQHLGFRTTMSNIAASLTDLTIKDPHANNVTGYLGTVETVVHVRWKWLALPAFLVLGGSLFLLLTIIVNSRSMAPIWKSSVNALLYHGLEDDLADHGDLLTVASMTDMAASANVSLITSRRSARLVLATPPPPSSHTVPTMTSESTGEKKTQTLPRVMTI